MKFKSILIDSKSKNTYGFENILIENICNDFYDNDSSKNFKKSFITSNKNITHIIMSFEEANKFVEYLNKNFKSIENIIIYINNNNNISSYTHNIRRKYKENYKEDILIDLNNVFGSITNLIHNIRYLNIITEDKNNCFIQILFKNV